MPLSNQLIFSLLNHVFCLTFSGKKDEKCYFYWPDKERQTDDKDNEMTTDKQTNKEMTYSNKLWEKEEKYNCKTPLGFNILKALRIPIGFS